MRNLKQQQLEALLEARAFVCEDMQGRVTRPAALALMDLFIEQAGEGNEEKAELIHELVHTVCHTLGMLASGHPMPGAASELIGCMVQAFTDGAGIDDLSGEAGIITKIFNGTNTFH